MSVLLPSREKKNEEEGRHKQNIGILDTEFQVIMDDGNISRAFARQRKLVVALAVSFGLLCVLQASLNVSFRLIHRTDTSDNKTPNCTTAMKDEEEAQLRIFWKVLELSGWKYFRGSVYYLSHETRSWQNSRSECLQKGADLVIINSQEEQDFVIALNDRVWIGLTDNETEGTWTWVDGTLVNTSFWKVEEPNGDREENCAEVINYHGYGIFWNDHSCTSWMNRYVCERNVF